jgi:hypothetical protein
MALDLLPQHLKWTQALAGIGGRWEGQRRRQGWLEVR